MICGLNTTEDSWRGQSRCYPWRVICFGGPHGADRAIGLFLLRDALAPAVPTAFMSDRAARRLCDRLVDRGVVLGLTERRSFRRYGV